MTKIETLAEGLLVLSDLVAADTHVSWLPPGARGFEPHNKYVVLEPNDLLLLDTGVAAHGPALVGCLDRIIGARRLTVLLTRSELDCVGNLPPIVDRFPDACIITTNALPPLGLVHRPGARAGAPASHRIPIGQSLEAFGFARVRTVAPAIRTLGTTWAFDEQTRTLFSSDFFGADLLSLAEQQVIRRDCTDLGTPEAVRAWILAKFDWLQRARLGELVQKWDGLFGQIEPAALAPAHGRPQVGRDLVARVVSDYRAALFEFPEHSRQPAACL